MRTVSSFASPPENASGTAATAGWAELVLFVVVRVTITVSCPPLSFGPRSTLSTDIFIPDVSRVILPACPWEAEPPFELPPPDEVGAALGEPPPALGAPPPALGAPGLAGADAVGADAVGADPADGSEEPRNPNQ